MYTTALAYLPYMVILTSQDSVSLLFEACVTIHEDYWFALYIFTMFLFPFLLWVRGNYNVLLY